MAAEPCRTAPQDAREIPPAPPRGQQQQQRHFRLRYSCSSEAKYTPFFQTRVNKQTVLATTDGVYCLSNKIHLLLRGYIFKKKGVNQISYLDTDFYFFKSPVKLIESNVDSSVILIQQNVNDKYGRYNVGWIYFNFDYKETVNIVNEWSDQCLNKCSDMPDKKTYADQKYLDTWIAKLIYSRVFQPEHTCLSPWDPNIALEENKKTMIAFHFHGLEVYQSMFSSGFHKYNKKFDTDKKIAKITWLK